METEMLDPAIRGQPRSRPSPPSRKPPELLRTAVRLDDGDDAALLVHHRGTQACREKVTLEVACQAGDRVRGGSLAPRPGQVSRFENRQRAAGTRRVHQREQRVSQECPEARGSRFRTSRPQPSSYRGLEAAASRAAEWRPGPARRARAGTVRILRARSRGESVPRPS